MINFDIHISPDNKNLVVHATVDSTVSYYDNVSIKDIYIDNQDTFTESGPSDNYLFHEELEGSPDNKDHIWNIAASELSLKGGNLASDVLYIYITVDGEISADAPCGMNSTTALAVAFNAKDILKQSIAYMTKLEDSCTPPKGFIDFILKLKAIKYALQAQNYTKANKYWNKFFKGKETLVLNTKGCGCI